LSLCIPYCSSKRSTQWFSLNAAFDSAFIATIYTAQFFADEVSLNTAII
jgi:hypothetical protein